MRRQRATKILATLGPSSTAEDQIAQLFEAGADIFRLNFSHGTHEEHKQRYDHIRNLEKKFNRCIGVLADLQGPKLRIGQLKEDFVMLEAGQSFTLDNNPDPGDETRVYLPHPELFEALKPGADLLIFDGKIRLKITSLTKTEIKTTVTFGGKLTSTKGVNVPDVALPVSALTEKDRKDLEYALKLGVDWVALSFVQRPEDILEAKEIIQGKAKIVSKLEKPQAIEQLNEIIDLSDGIMVARGDLGVEIPLEKVPPLQKRIIRKCRHAGKPVIVATQMLDSMVKAPTPTRAEASDVATAVYDGADAVMLSEESAAGQYAVESVQMMNRIIEAVEQDEGYYKIQMAYHAEIRTNTSDAISASARTSAESVDASSIISYTATGGTAMSIARQRPVVPILCISGKVETARYLSLVWGVHAIHTEEATDFDQMVKIGCSVAYEEQFSAMGDKVVITAGTPFGTPGSTNVLRIATIRDRNLIKLAV